MSHTLIISMDVADRDRSEFEHWLRSSFLNPSGVPGLDEQAACFRGIRVETRFRTYLPTPSYFAIFTLTDDPARIVATKEFAEWWAAGIAARFGWIQKQHWVVASLVTGPPLPLGTATRALITQVHLPPAYQDGWGQWYDEVHIPQSRQVPGLFEAENRRFSAIDLVTSRWNCVARPQFTHFVPIRDEADIALATATPEYLALMADTQARWAGTMESACSTICERFQ